MLCVTLLCCEFVARFNHEAVRSNPASAVRQFFTQRMRSEGRSETRNSAHAKKTIVENDLYPPRALQYGHIEI